MKMTVLYVKSTGQVMAAVTRAALADEAPVPAADPDAATPEVAALAGEALQVRSFPQFSSDTFSTTRFAIPANRLAALTVERDDAQLLSPRRYAVLDGKKLETFPLDKLSVNLAATATNITVTITDDLQEALPFVLHLMPEEGLEPGQHFDHTFQPHAHAVNFGLTKPLNGRYGALMLFRGYPPAVWPIEVPSKSPSIGPT